MDISRYQFCTFVRLEFIASTAFVLKETGESPGGAEIPFCVQLYTASIFHSSNLSSVPASEVTASTRNNAPLSFTILLISCRGCNTPVDVSACTIATTLGSD